MKSVLIPRCHRAITCEEINRGGNKQHQETKMRFCVFKSNVLSVEFCDPNSNETFLHVEVEIDTNGNDLTIRFESAVDGPMGWIYIYLDIDNREGGNSSYCSSYNKHRITSKRSGENKYVVEVEMPINHWKTDNIFNIIGYDFKLSGVSCKLIEM